MEKKEMNRREELDEIFKNADEEVKKLIAPTLDRVVFLERQIKGLEGLPAEKRRSKEWWKRHKDIAAQYDACMRLLLKALGKAEAVEVSPLREYLESLNR